MADDEQHSDALAADVAALIANGLATASIPADVHARLRKRVLERATPAGMRVVRADGGTWVMVLPGVHVKHLRVDAATGMESTLWRLDAGAHIPAHDHGDDEECLVLEGNIRQNGIDYGRGDYLHALAGSRHARMDAPHGALLMIRSQPVSGYFARSGG